MKTTMRIIAPAIFAATFWGGLADAQDKVLRFATWDSDESLAIEEAIARKFEEANPGVKVQVEAYGDGYDAKLTAAMGAGSPPDVMYMWNFPAYKESLMPLDDMIARDAEAMNLADIPAGLMNISKIGSRPPSGSASILTTCKNARGRGRSRRGCEAIWCQFAWNAQRTSCSPG